MVEDIVDRLKYLRDLPVGSPLPQQHEIKGWAGYVAGLCADAVKEIERLRRLEAGAIEDFV